MSTDARAGFRLGPWRIEPSRGAVIGPGGEVRHVEPKVMEVLVRLAATPGRLVTREELLASVWTRHVAADQLLTDNPFALLVGKSGSGEPTLLIHGALLAEAIAPATGTIARRAPAWSEVEESEVEKEVMAGPFGEKWVALS